MPAQLIAIPDLFLYGSDGVYLKQYVLKQSQCFIKEITILVVLKCEADLCVSFDPLQCL